MKAPGRLHQLLRSMKRRGIEDDEICFDSMPSWAEVFADLAKLDPDGVETLLRQTNRGRPYRAAAIMALGSLPSRHRAVVVPCLLKVLVELCDEHPGESSSDAVAAAEAIRKLKSPVSGDELLPLLRKRKKGSRALVIELCGELKSASSGILSGLERLSREGSSAEQAAATKAIQALQ